MYLILYVYVIQTNYLTNNVSHVFQIQSTTIPATLSIPITLDEMQQSDLTAGKYFSKVRLIVVDTSEQDSPQLQISIAEAPDPDPSLADAADKTPDLEEPILMVNNASKTLLEMFEQGDQPNWVS